MVDGGEGLDVGPFEMLLDGESGLSPAARPAVGMSDLEL